MPGDSWKLAPGLNAVGAYQVSGIPFASGGIDCTTATKVQFPHVTKWVWVQNRFSGTGVTNLKIGFSQLGVEGDNWIALPDKHSGAPDRASYLPIIDVKVSEIWLSGSSNVDIVAGLTYVPKQRTDTDKGTSWSGSAGVG